MKNPFQMYKKAFIDEKLWAVLSQNLGKLLRKNFDERSEDDRMVIERILILVRNILQVKKLGHFTNLVPSYPLIYYTSFEI